MNITFQWDDVVNVIRNISSYLIALGIIVALAIVAAIIVKNMDSIKKSFIRKQSLIAALVSFVLIINLVCFGPMSALINAATSEKMSISEETLAESRNVVEKIAAEGIVLAKNNDLLPLNKGNLNVFGWASVNPLYGGSGSGAIDSTHAVSLIGGLEKAGFTVNKDLEQFYNDYETKGRGRVGSPRQEWTLPEPVVSSYSDSLISDAKNFSDTAVIVLGRSGGEGADLPNDMGAVIDGSWNTGIYYKNASFVNNTDEYNEFEAGETYLELSHTEKDMVDLVCSNFDNVVVIYNGANTFELNWTNEYDAIKSVLLVPGVGETGFTSLGKVFSGEVNPSGRTTDTWVKDLTNIPSFNNYGEFAYNSRLDLVSFLEEKNGPARIQGVGSFVNYVEGIYTGYRFYETADQEGLINYDEEVLYPFGHGLSYSEFTQEMGDLQVSADSISVDVTVTNSGSVAGKEVVQLYYNPPYTNGGIEKAYTNLVAFDKTKMLAPGESEVITLSFDKEDMASFDVDGESSYVLEAGNYVISLNKDSHNSIDERVYTQASEIVYNSSNKRDTDLEPATGRLGFAEGDFVQLSRKDGFANYEEAVKAPKEEEYDVSLEELIPYFVYDETEYNNPSDAMPTLGAKNGVELLQLRGKDYNDPQWDQLLDQLTFNEMVDLIQFGGYQTVAVKSVDKVATKDVDGASGINDFIRGDYGTGFNTALLLSQTWNLDLAVEQGVQVGKEGGELGISGWYAPSLNMHRTPFGGRNFEYYSEDGFFAGKMGASVAAGNISTGLYPYLKHFVLNDQEINRHSIFTWADEQTIREIYLKPFEIAVKENRDGPLAIMSSYNYLGREWAGSSPELLNDILRGEWGFQGMVLTDYFNQFYMDADKAIRGGNDIMLSSTGGQNAVITDQSATSIKAMKQASKNIFYTVVNSNAYENYTGASLPAWIITFIIIDVILGVVLLLSEFLIIRKFLLETSK